MKTITTMILCSILAAIGFAFGGETNAPIQDLPQWNGKTIQTVMAELGVTTNEVTYTIGSAPTKGWNHGILFSVYPKSIPENQNVFIKEYIWDQGQYEVRACCHHVKKAWLVMGAMKIDKRVRF